MHQITFEEYLKEKNMEYAKQCRHSLGNYCCVKRCQIGTDALCPCEVYEVRGSCEKCRYNRLKGYSKECLTGCKRYPYNPNVICKKLEDKYDNKRTN